MGKHSNIQMVLQSQTAPRLEIREGVSKVNGDALIRILNPYASEYDAVMMKCSFVLSIEFELLDNMTLAGKITDMQAKVNEIEVYFMSDITTASMDSQVTAIASPFSTLINTQLIQGFQLPLPRGIRDDLSKTRLFTYDRFILIESDPQVQKRFQEKVTEAVSSLSRFI